MSNRTYLYNTPVLTSDMDELFGLLDKPGNDFFEAAEGAYRIPLPWLLCFTADDLRPSSIAFENDDGTERLMPIEMPCTTTAAALENLKKSLPIFESLAGDPAIGREYWQDAIDGLSKLPLPYLVINAHELFYLSEPADFVLAIKRDREAMMGIAGYIEGALPYSMKELREEPLERDDPRTQNAVALDGWMSDPETGFWHRYREPQAESPEDSNAGKTTMPPPADPVPPPDLGKLWLSRFASAGMGLVFNVPKSWEDTSTDTLFGVRDPVTGAQFSASAEQSIAADLGTVATVRMMAIGFQKGLGQFREQYEVRGNGWVGLAAEYRGTSPGDDHETHYLELYLKNGELYITLSLTTDPKTFEENEGVFRWYLIKQLTLRPVALPDFDTFGPVERVMKGEPAGEIKTSQPQPNRVATVGTDTSTGAGAGAAVGAWLAALPASIGRWLLALAKRQMGWVVLILVTIIVIGAAVLLQKI